MGLEQGGGEGMGGSLREMISRMDEKGLMNLNSLTLTGIDLKRYQSTPSENVFNNNYCPHHLLPMSEHL